MSTLHVAILSAKPFYSFNQQPVKNVKLRTESGLNNWWYLDTKLYSPGVESFLLQTASITAAFSFSQLIVENWKMFTLNLKIKTWGWFKERFIDSLWKRDLETTQWVSEIFLVWLNPFPSSNPPPACPAASLPAQGPEWFFPTPGDQLFNFAENLCQDLIRGNLATIMDC